jgi:hypothetical protein
MHSSRVKSIVWVVVLLAACSLLNAQSFKLNAVSDLVRVFEDGYDLPALSDTVKLFGIRGEVISGQCLLSTKKNLTNVVVSISDFRHLITGHPLSGNTVDWNFVGSIPLAGNAPNQLKSSVVRQAPARFPDYLMSERQINIKEKVFQAIWLTVSIPETIEAGTFAGKVIVKSSQGERALPVHLTVYPLTLPADRHLKVTEWYTTTGFEQFHGIKEKYSEAWFAMLRTYADNMASHRQNVFEVPMNAIEIERSKKGELEFDFSRFDQIAQVFWDTKKMDYLETGELTKFEKDWYSKEIVFKDFSVKDLETNGKSTVGGKDVIPFLLPAFENHLRQKGWLNKTFFHVKDEPSLHNVMSWREVSSTIHRLAPDLKRMDAIETTFLLDEIEIAVPKIDAFGSWLDAYKKGQQKGTELWFYTVGIYQASLYPNKTIDMPVMDNRILHWLNYQYDATGFLHWGWNQWTENPYREVGEHLGDGWHVYPVKVGVLNSLRWEQMRNGIQDYEYLWMLENRVSALRDSLGSHFDWIDPKQPGKAIASQVVMDLSKHTHQPEILYRAKKQIINELMELSSSPRMYVQTNPRANSTLTNGASVEVLGWTEPGTKIVVNGKELPVNHQGLFLEKFEVSTKDNRIRVEAGSTRGTKEIVRNFLIEQSVPAPLR